MYVLLTLRNASVMLIRRRSFKLKHLVLLLASFVIAVIILYKKAQNEEELHVLDKDGLDLEEFSPTMPPPVRVWIIVHVKDDICLSLASTFPEWTILQYGDIQPPDLTARHKRCHYFVNQQKPRKVILQADVFLYAIQMGAEAIYVLSSETANNKNFPQHIILKNVMDGLMASSNDGYFSPLEHWGCNYTHINQQHGKHHSYRLCKSLRPSIQAEATCVGAQGEENDPAEIIVNESCDSSSPDIVVSSGTYACFHMGNTLYMKDAFWSLPVAEVSDSSDQMCFSFLIQKLLWLTGRYLFLHSGWSLHNLKNVAATKLETCRTFLEGINCKLLNFTACFRKVCEGLPVGMFAKHGLEYQMHWLETLELNGYQLPVIQPQVQMECDPMEVHYTPVEHKVTYKIKKWRITPFPPINNIAAIHDIYKNKCKRNAMEAGIEPDFLAPWTIWEDVLLIVIFNNPFYEVIPYLEVLYRSFFPHMLYCGPSMPANEDFKIFELFNIPFVSYGATPAGHTPGSFNYRCLVKAIDMKYNVRGYLFIADDLLLIPKRLKPLSLEKAWFVSHSEIRIADIKSVKECRLGMCDFHPNWRWWDEYQDATLKALQDMKERRKESVLINQCLKTLANLNYGDFHVNGGYSDIYYIPNYLAESFSQLFSIFLEHYVFLEIAVPTVFRCLVPDTELEVLQGKQIWDETRASPWSYFTKHHLAYKSYLHPVKWSYLEKGSAEYNSLFCSVVSHIHDPYSRMNKITTS